MEHFGVKVTSKEYAYNLRRDEFALMDTKPSLPKSEGLMKKNAYTDNSGREYRREWCEEYRKLCLKNFDLNMEYFASLDAEEFNMAISDFLHKYPEFCEIKDLSAYDRIAGYYIMVLDEYKQIYIGKSDNIKRRIQQHWSNTKPFDRTLFPMYDVEHSCFSIDFFRALDTTRIYVWETFLQMGIERELINNFPKEYRTNRIGGDISDGIEALFTLTKRKLV